MNQISLEEIIADRVSERWSKIDRQYKREGALEEIVWQEIQDQGVRDKATSLMLEERVKKILAARQKEKEEEMKKKELRQQQIKGAQKINEDELKRGASLPDD